MEMESCSRHALALLGTPGSLLEDVSSEAVGDIQDHQGVKSLQPPRRVFVLKRCYIETCDLTHTLIALQYTRPALQVRYVLSS